MRDGAIWGRDLVFRFLGGLVGCRYELEVSTLSRRMFFLRGVELKIQVANVQVDLITRSFELCMFAGI